MSKTRTEVLAESRKKGVVAGATTAGAVAAGVLVAPVAGVVAAVPARPTLPTNGGSTGPRTVSVSERNHS